MKIIATSDTHGAFPEIPECDLFIHAGDITPVLGNPDCRDWMDTQLRKWLSEIPAENIVFIGGNHDMVFRTRAGRDILATLPAQYLEDQTISVDGLIIHGSPWTPKYGNWAFMDYDPELSKYWNKIPKYVDILVTHGPPHGVLDVNSLKNRTGSASLLNYMNYFMQCYPRLHLFGHIHEGYGTTEIDGCTFANLAYWKIDFRTTNPIMEFVL